MNVSVPPRTEVKAFIIMTRSTIRVHYTMVGKVVLRSGREVDNYTEKGIFVGNNAHDLIVKIEQTNIDTKNNISNIVSL